jgi:hypothetical protein
MWINNRNNKKWLVLLVAVMLVGVFSAALSVGSVYAESNGVPTLTPPPSEKPAGVFPGIILERVHNFQIRIIEILGNQLNNANKIESKAQLRIAELKQQGKDVSALEDALSKFYSFVATSKQAKDNASATLNLHQGFDTQGKITDPKLARDTNKSLEVSIRICRENFVQALKIIANGLKIYKQQNSPQPASM